MADVLNEQYVYGHIYESDYNEERIIMQKTDNNYRYLVSYQFYLDNIYQDLIDQGLNVSKKYHPKNGYKVGPGSNEIRSKLINLKESKTGVYPKIMIEHNIDNHLMEPVIVYEYGKFLIKLDGITYNQDRELKYKFKNISNNCTEKSRIIYHGDNNRSFIDTNKVLLSELYVKILDCEESSSLFGFRPTKREMIGGYYKINNIDYSQICKKDNIERIVVEVENKELGKNLKFVLSDLEVQIPNLTDFIKGYNTPKDRKIKLGVQVKVVNNKLTRLNIGDKLKVVNIFDKTIPTISNFKDKCQIIQCVNESGKQFNLKLKQVKVI